MAELAPAPVHVAPREPLAPEHEHDGFALVVRNLAAGYPGFPPAIEGINLRVPVGELVGLIGPNGAGKSTLFKAMLGLITPIEGEVLAFGRPVAKAREQIAYMPQVEEVDWDFPVSVLDVVLMGRYKKFRPFARWSAEDREAAMAALERVQLAPYARRQVGQLSGGQRRRVLMARAIARGAGLLLLDEPFAGLDAAVQHDLVEILDGLAREGKAILVATHDLSCVANSCDEAICLNRRIIAQGPSADVLTEEVLSQTFQRHLLAVPRHGVIQVINDEHGVMSDGDGGSAEGGR
ncbi:MAG: metal ABC transporter ATP-binding protein [Chloroflexi bacterium]|nr:metal ABC transporter ATP-binding protein [Chloroflexota bacterium]MDA1239286.1 metal ABC transporter ATP-binding protein [Chloroflexota bacterium]